MSRVQSASHAGPCTCVVTSVEQKELQFFEIAAIVSQEGGAAHTINLCRNCYNDRRAKQGEAEVNGVKVEGADRAEVLPRGKLWAAFWCGTVLRNECGNNPQSKKSVGQIGFGRCRKCDAIGEQTAGNNTRRRNRRSSSFCGTALTCASRVSLMRQAYNAEKSGDWGKT